MVGRYRYHKQLMKTVCTYKRKNFNKDKKEKVFGTGERFLSWLEHRDYIEQTRIQHTGLSFNGRWNKDGTPSAWEDRHQDQVMESMIHDRTRWSSNKKKDKNRSYDRKIKLENQFCRECFFFRN